MNVPDTIVATRCSLCHGLEGESASPVFPRLAGQTIRPYTDLLVHDMGKALSDGRPDGLANGREWRTPPLWGIGLTQSFALELAADLQCLRLLKDARKTVCA